MIERGKFRSLTLINWNGFFARTFDLDELVTTLSGGNGAGKSTTMAAFVTALIPDLTLLHFRNTTEAGATSGSRDKGLHGKLKAGVCYSMLDVLNSRHQRVVVGVRLQQVAGRDRKVDIKPFAIQGLPMSVQPTQLVTETLNERQARVLSLPELKEKLLGRLEANYQYLLAREVATLRLTRKLSDGEYRTSNVTCVALDEDTLATSSAAQTDNKNA